MRHANRQSDTDPTSNTCSSPEEADITTPARTYDPLPGTEYRFSISDIARAAAQLLGEDWNAESGAWGVTGTLHGPHSTEFTFCVDYESDFVIEFHYSTDDDFPEKPDLPDGVSRCDAGVYLELASAADGLAYLTERSAAAIRAITGC